MRFTLCRTKRTRYAIPNHVQPLPPTLCGGCHPGCYYPFTLPLLRPCGDGSHALRRLSNRPATFRRLRPTAANDLQASGLPSPTRRILQPDAPGRAAVLRRRLSPYYNSHHPVCGLQRNDLLKRATRYFSLQKWRGLLLPCETIPFAGQKVWYGRAKGMVSQSKSVHISCALIISLLRANVLVCPF